MTGAIYIFSVYDNAYLCKVQKEINYNDRLYHLNLYLAMKN